MRKASKVLAAVVLPACALLAGCPAQKPRAAKESTPPGMKIPQYVSARAGLPNGKIWKSQIAFGDINNDGFADLGAVSRLADGPWIWAGDGKGNWTDASAGLPREAFCGGGMDFGDVNRDGHMDVAIADHCKGVFVFLGDGAGRWKSASAGLPTIGCEDVAFGDFNKDGCLDLVTVAASEEGVRVFTGNCKGVWRESSTGLAHTEWGNSVTVADMNGDGNLDIVAAYSAGPRVWLGDGRGNWQEASAGLPAPEVHGLFWGIAVGDINGDGRPDVVATDQSRGPQVYLQTDAGGYVATDSRQCVGGANDGLFCQSSADCPGGTCATHVCKGVCVKGARGNACFTDDDCEDPSPPRPGREPEAPKCDVPKNLGQACNSEGNPAQCVPGTCSAVQNGHGLPLMNALGIAVGDMNNDGKADLVVAGKTNTREIGGVYGVFVFLGDGRGNFTMVPESAGLPHTGRERTWGVGLADIDRDGVLDIGVAFGDVLPPTFRSGDLVKKPAKKAEKKPGFFGRLFGGKAEEKAPSTAPTEAPKPPERGFFGSIEVWRGQLP